MRYQGRSDNTEVEIDDEDVYISGKFRSRYSAGFRAKNQRQDGDPDNNGTALENKSRNCPLKMSVFCHSPELEMPGVH